MRKTLLHRKKLQTNPKKQYVKKFRIYPSFLYSRLDKWLKQMSLKGWHIVHCGWFFFYFEKGMPAEKEYFTYGMATQEGRYSISLQYPFLKQTYGLKKSSINSNETKKHQIIEIDRHKFDVKNDVAYKELVSDRNRLYLRYFVRNLSIIAVIIAVLIVLLF